MRPGMTRASMESNRSLIAVPPAAATVRTPSAATTTTAATRTFITRAGDIDGQCAAIPFLTVQRINGFLRLLRRAHRDEGKAAGPSAHFVEHQVGFRDRAERGERVLQVIFCGIEGKVSYKQSTTHVM